MLNSLQRWMGVRTSAERDGAVECFGEARVPREEGLEILRGTAVRRGQLQGIRDGLPSMTRAEKDELVDRVWARVALYVFDLPASRAHHHSRRFGLLDHLLEVAQGSVQKLSAPSFQISPEPSINHRERPLWVYAGVVAALAHDIGKPLDLDVLVPGSPAVWNPRIEPLRLFCRRQGLEETGPALWNFHSGRGWHGHERHSQEIFPFVVPPSVAEYLGPRLPAVLHALFSGQDYRTAPDLSWAACEVVKVVRWVDQTTARKEGDLPGLPKEAGPRGSKLEPATPPSPEGLATPSPAIEEPACAPAESSAAALPASRPPLAAPPQASPRIPVPADFWREKVQRPRNRRGDPEENRRRLEVELAPDRLLDTIRRLIVMCRLSRNALQTDIYVQYDAVWLIVPRSLRRIARIIRLPFDTEVLRVMLHSLGASPLVEPWCPEQVPFYIKTQPNSMTYQAVRIRTLGFLSGAELAEVGLHAPQIRIVDPRRPSAPEEKERRERL